MIQSIDKLYRKLLDAHHRGLIHVQAAEFNPIKEVQIVFPSTTPVLTQDTLAAHINRHYNVQAYWERKEILIVKSL